MFDPNTNNGPPDRKPENINEKALLWTLGIAFGGFMLIGFLSDFTPRKLSAFFFLLSWPVLLIIHEFGHALMAKALGWHVEMVSIGSGSLRSTRRILGMTVEFRSVPLSGFARTRATDLIQPQLKNCLIYAAGPGIEIILVLIAAMLLGFDTMLTRTDHIGFIAVQSFCVAALTGAIINLIPFPHQTENGIAWSDGLGMIMSWKLPDEYFAQQIR